MSFQLASQLQTQMKKLGRKIKLNFSQHASKSGFEDKKMDLDPSPNAGVYCYSVRVSVQSDLYYPRICYPRNSIIRGF